MENTKMNKYEFMDNEGFRVVVWAENEYEAARIYREMISEN